MTPKTPSKTLRFFLAAEAAKTKSVGGKEYPASDFAYVGDPDKPATWNLLIADADHVRDALARFDQTDLPDSAKKRVAKKLVAKAKTMGIDASGFKQKYLSAEADLSLDEQQSLLNAALCEQFGLDGQGMQRFYLFEAFDDYLVARGPEGKLYRIPYTIDGDEVELESAQEVTTAYVPVAEACEFTVSEATAATDDRVYPVTVLKAGWAGGALNGQAAPHYYPPEFVRKVAEALQDIPFGRRHPDQRGGDPVGANDPARIAGWVGNGSFDGQRALGTVTLLDAESDLRGRLDSARKAGKLNLFGVYMLGLIGFRSGRVDGKDCLVAESLSKLYSVDLCAVAGAGGQFLVAASLAANDLAAAQLRAVNPQSTAIAPGKRGNHGGTASATEGASMKKSILQMLESLRQKNAAVAAELSLKFATVSESEYPALLTQVTDAVLAATTPAPTTTAMTAESAQGVLDQAHRIQSRNRIESKLAESKLPEPAKKLAREHLELALVSEANLQDASIDTEITRVREAFAAFNTVGRIHGAARVTLDTADKMSLAMECALGVKESAGKGVPAFRGLREAYTSITGDYDLQRLSRGGGFSGHMLASEAVLTGDFPNILLNSMTKRLLQDYAELAIDGLDTLYTKASISDFKLQDRVREGYFAELATVVEGATYQEITYPTDERVSYQVGKYGNLLTISEETIRNDDLGAISRFPGRLARSGRWTLKNYITNFFASNPNYGADSLAWFSAGHSNTGTTALSQDALIAMEIALMTQTEKNSGEPLGLTLDWLMVPPQLAATARQINQTNTAGSNAFYQRFGVNNERIIVNEKLTEVDDYYGGTMQDKAPFLEIGFLDGIEQPQIFLANQPTIGTQFTADELQYKVKMAFAGAIIDYRGVYKQIV